MIFRQLTHDDLGCASYLVGDEDAGVAAVVDPRLAIDEYLELARYTGVRIEHILETHNHADHVSGHARLAMATGATIHINRLAEASYPHDPFDDGWELELGDVVVRAVHTPGHRPEHTAFLLIDGARGEEPWALLSGDSLFVGDVARPDLAVESEEGARGIHRSLTERLMTLPDDCEVWPGHLGGSLCGGPGMDMKVSSTIGYERAHNSLLREEDEDAFVEATTSGLAPQPPNFERIVEVNRGPLSTVTNELLALSPHQVAERAAAGALVVDVRTDVQFDEGHVPRSASNTALRAGFGTKLAWIAADADEVVLVGRDDEDARRAARLAAAVAVDSVSGYLAGGMTSWREEGRDVVRTPRIGAAELADELTAGADVPKILDVREKSEFEEGHVPGSVGVPYHQLTELPGGIVPGERVAVVCSSGQRAAVGASLIERHGIDDVIHVVDGGVGTLAERGVELEPGS